MSRPSLRSIKFWNRFENSVLKTFELALEKLSEKNCLPDNEDEINRILRICVFEAITELNFPERESHWSVIYEANNQPSIADEIRAKREDKRPDFQCAIFNKIELNPRRGQIFFVIECKRLGKPPSSSWILNKNYIVNGICRFIKKEWAYAADYSSGAMIGYLQNTGIENIYTEISTHAEANSIPPLTFIEKNWKTKVVNILKHQVRRKEVKPHDFNLTHLWVKLLKDENQAQ